MIISTLGLKILRAYSPYKSINQITKEVRCNKETVKYWLKKLGLQTMSQRVLGEQNRIRAKKAWEKRWQEQHRM